MQRVHAGHGEINPIKQFDISEGHAGGKVQRVHVRTERISRYQLARNQMISILVVILDRLYAEERRAQNHCQDQTKNRALSFSDLRRVNSHRHGKAADDQYAGIDRAEPDVQVIAGGRERYRILIAIERVSEEHPTKKHDLGHEKHPHAERPRFTLLLHVLEMVLQRCVVRRVFVSCR